MTLGDLFQITLPIAGAIALLLSAIGETIDEKLRASWFPLGGTDFRQTMIIFAITISVSTIIGALFLP